MGLPPLLGADHDTVAWRPPATALTPVGADGLVAPEVVVVVDGLVVVVVNGFVVVVVNGFVAVVVVVPPPGPSPVDAVLSVLIPPIPAPPDLEPVEVVEAVVVVVPDPEA